MRAGRRGRRERRGRGVSQGSLIVVAGFFVSSFFLRLFTMEQYKDHTEREFNWNGK